MTHKKNLAPYHIKLTLKVEIWKILQKSLKYEILATETKFHPIWSKFKHLGAFFKT